MLDGYGRPALSESDLILARGRELLADLRKELKDSVRSNSTRQERDAAERQNDGNLFNAANLFNQFPNVPYQSTTVSGPITLAYANNYVPVSLNQILLSYAFMTQGFLRTVVKEPVDDAFRGGFSFESGELDENDIALLVRTMKRVRSRREIKNGRGSIGSKVQYNAGNDLQRSDFSAIKNVGYWGRLYGGSGLIINVAQDFRAELDPELITEDSPLEFIPADRWELTLGSTNLFATNNPCPFNYYGYPLNGSRVLKFLWNDAPAYIRQRLQGWGMSEVEHCIRPVNAYLKMENLMFELMDEAKTDVYLLEGFASTRTNKAANANVVRMMQDVNQIKNYRNALVLDNKDKYEQKQLAFSGLAEIRNSGRMDLAAAIRFPLNKLFGDSATGFGGGQDAMENYNAQVSTFRDSIEPLVIGAGELRCQQLFGFIPEDLRLKLQPLRELSGVEQEDVLTQRSVRTLAWFQAGLMNGKEASEQGKKDDVLKVDTEVLRGEKDAMPLDLAQGAAEEMNVSGQGAGGVSKPRGVSDGSDERDNSTTRAARRAVERRERRMAGKRR